MSFSIVFVFCINPGGIFLCFERKTNFLWSFFLLFPLALSRCTTVLSVCCTQLFFQSEFVFRGSCQLCSMILFFQLSHSVCLNWRLVQFFRLKTSFVPFPVSSISSSKLPVSAFGRLKYKLSSAQAIFFSSPSISFSNGADLKFSNKGC